MSFWNETISIDTHGVWRSLGVVGILFIGLLMSARPSFVIPEQLIDTKKRLLIRILTGVFIVAILLLPLDIRFKVGERLVESSTRYVEVVLDVSLSMSAKDVDPSRFIVAQRTLDQLISSLDNATVGVIAFSGIPVVHIAFSDQLLAVRQRLQETTLADFPPTVDFLGTAMGDALLLALEKIDEIDTQNEKNAPKNAPKNAVIILITDGDTSEGVDPLEVATLAKRRGIAIYTLGIGDDMTILGVDTAGEKVIASLDSDMLERIASLTQGTFSRIIDSATMERTISEFIANLKIDQQSEFIVEFWSLNKLLVRIIIFIACMFLVRKIALWMRIVQVVKEKTTN